MKQFTRQGQALQQDARGGSSITRPSRLLQRPDYLLSSPLRPVPVLVGFLETQFGVHLLSRQIVTYHL